MPNNKRKSLKKVLQRHTAGKSASAFARSGKVKSSSAVQSAAASGTAKSLAKVLISKELGGPGKSQAVIIHPSSRKASQLQRALLRHQRIQTQKEEQWKSADVKKPLIGKLLWFKWALDPEQVERELTSEEIHGLIELYLQRFDEDISQAEEQQKLRKQPVHPRINLLRAQVQSERQQYETGFEVPDLTIAKNVKALCQWEGDWNCISTIKLTKVTRPAEIVEMVEDQGSIN